MPTSALPKRCRCGSTVGQETDEINQDHGDADDDVIDEMGERGHILWIRGLSRLQHQVSAASVKDKTAYVDTEIRPITHL